MCLNLGGFSNISYEQQDMRKAFDICPVNNILNKFAAEMGLDYDRNGNEARKGWVDNDLLDRMNSLRYHNLEPPKSLGREWLEQNMIPLIEERQDLSLRDKLRTVTEHIALQVGKTVNRLQLSGSPALLITGGGAGSSCTTGSSPVPQDSSPVVAKSRVQAPPARVIADI